MTDFSTILGGAEYELEISRSKFICRMTRTDSLAEGLAFVAEIKKRYSDATHNCYAIIGTPESNEQKFSDDGEPSGTAGQPIFGVLAKNGLYAVTAVVTRYFGGIKLGAGGLVNAYSKVTAGCVGTAKIVQSVWSAIFKADLTYAQHKAAERGLAGLGAKTIDTAFGTGVNLTLAVPAADALSLDAFLSELTLGQQCHKLCNHQYIIY